MHVNFNWDFPKIEFLEFRDLSPTVVSNHPETFNEPKKSRENQIHDFQNQIISVQAKNVWKDDFEL